MPLSVEHQQQQRIEQLKLLCRNKTNYSNLDSNYHVKVKYIFSLSGQ